MTFASILSEKAEGSRKKETQKPSIFFIDLHLDQIINAITDGKQEYNLKPFFYTPLNDLDVITYRHEVMREHLTQAGKMYYTYQKEAWFLDAKKYYQSSLASYATFTCF